MRIRDLKLKLLVTAERWMRRFADYLSRATSAPAESEDGPPQDWLDRVRRAGGPMISHSMGVAPAGPPRRPAIAPARLLDTKNGSARPNTVQAVVFQPPPASVTSIGMPQSAGVPQKVEPGLQTDPLPPMAAVSLMAKSGDVPIFPAAVPLMQGDSSRRRQGVTREDSLSEEALPGDATQQLPPMPEIRYETWQRPLKPKRTQYPPSIFSKGGSQKGAVSGREPERIHPESPGIGFAQKADLPGRQTDPLPPTAAVPLYQGDSKPAHINEATVPLIQAVNPDDFFRKASGNRAVKHARASGDAIPLSYEERQVQPALSKDISPSGIQYSETLSFTRAEVQWPESLPLDWPQLPEETASNEDAELRVVRALEHRSRLDREQNGMVWSERPF